MEPKSLDDLGIFPSLKDKDIAFDIVKDDICKATFERHNKNNSFPPAIRSKIDNGMSKETFDRYRKTGTFPPAPKRKKKVLSKELTIEYTYSEKQFIKRINKALLKHSIKSRPFAFILSRIKNRCESKNINPSKVIDYLATKGIDWFKIRNLAKMKEYRGKHPICEVCGKRKSKHTHHKKHFAKGGQDIEGNYLAVCVPCHISLHPELAKGFIR